MAGFLIIMHFVTAGKQGDDLGTDETPIVLITVVVFDIKQSKSLLFEQYCVLEKDSTNELSKGSDNQTLLSEECVNETGLCDSMFENGQSLEFVLKCIHKSIGGVIPDSTSPSDSVLITDGQAPMRLVFHPEVARRNIDLTYCDYYHKFIDLRKEFKRFYNKEKITNLDGMVKECNIFTNANGGNYGIMESHKIFEIVRKMSDEGEKWSHVESVSKYYCSAIVKKSDFVSDDVVVRARGLPWQATDSDISRFFRGLNIEKGGIALVLSKVGRRNGEAIIRFECKDHRDMALRKHKHHMGQRYIEVYMATGRDFIQVAGGETDEAEAFLRKLNKPSQTLIRMRGLPYTATKSQILEFFSSTNCKVEFGEDGILFVNHRDGRATGDAFVIFETEAMAEEALKSHRENIGNRYIELFKSTPAEVNQVMNAVLNPSPSPPLMEDTSLLNLIPLLPNHIPIVTSSCVEQINQGRIFLRIKGMPLESSVADIINFLDYYSQFISFQGVHIVYNSMGQPAGEAIVQMVSEQTAALVVETKHKNLFTIALGKKSMVDVSACSGSDLAHFSGFIQSPNQTQLQMQNAFYQLQLLQKQFIPPAGFAINQVAYPHCWPYIPVSNSHNIGNIFTSSPTNNQLFPTPLINGTQTSLASPINSTTPNFIQTSLSQSQHPGLLLSTSGAPATLIFPNLSLIPSQNLNQDCNLVILKNLPRDVLYEEIVGVFEPILYQGAIISDIKVGMTSDATPTGEAFVTFANRVDAEKSVIECRNRYVRNTPIDISLY